MYQSIPSLTIPRASPQGFARSHYPEGRLFAQLSFCSGDQGFELEKFSTVPKEKFGNFSICFKESGGSLKSRCSCAVSYQFLQKHIDVYCIFDNIDRFRSFL